MERNQEDVARLVTKPEKVLDYINNGLLKAIFVSFVFWWLTKNMSMKQSFRKGTKSISLVFFTVSIITSFLCDWMAVFLSSKFVLDKALAEKMGYISGVYLQTIGSRHLDLIYVYNFLLTASQMLKICSLFLMTGSWMPVSRKDILEQIYPSIRGKNDSEVLGRLSDASIAVFSKIYTLLRIPLALIFVKYQIFLMPDTILFIRSVWFGLEVALCGLFLLILKTKYQGILNDNAKTQIDRYTGVSIFVTTLLADSFFNHIINVLSIPSTLGEATTYVIEKIGFLARMVSELILLATLCPQRHAFTDHERKVGYEDEGIYIQEPLDCVQGEQERGSEHGALVDLAEHA